MSDFINFVIGLIFIFIGSSVFLGFVYGLFFVARAGWSREWDKWNKVVAITEAAVKSLKESKESS